MTPKITAEQRAALDHSDGPVAVEDDETKRRYFLVDEITFASMQQKDDLAAIAEGIVDMEAGRVSSLGEVILRIRDQLKLSKS